MRQFIENEIREEKRLLALRNIVRKDFFTFVKYMNLMNTFQLKNLYTSQLMRDVGNSVDRKYRYKLIEDNNLQLLFSLIQGKTI